MDIGTGEQQRLHPGTSGRPYRGGDGADCASELAWVWPAEGGPRGCRLGAHCFPGSGPFRQGADGWRQQLWTARAGSAGAHGAEPYALAGASREGVGGGLWLATHAAAA